MNLEELEITSYNDQYEIAEKITIDESVFEQFRIYTKLYGASEWGGVCIGYQKDKTFHVRAIILPPQKIQSGGYCEFRKEIFPLVTKHIIRLTADKKELFDYRSGVWIHTHPGLGVFFSGTDFKSFKYLTSLSPDFLAVVVDPLRNEIIGYNGKLTTKTKEVPVKPVEEDDEEGELEKITEPIEIEEFTEIEVKIIASDLSDELELTFLKELRQVIQSNASAMEMGDKERTLTFIPIEENELKLNTMGMKVDFLEAKLAKMETRPTYSKDLPYDYIVWLHKHARQNKLDPDAVIPHTLVIKPEGILYTYTETSHRLSAGLVKWEIIEDIEGLILFEQPTTYGGYPAHLQVILLQIKHKKSGFLSKRPKDLQILYLCIDSNDLYRTLIEYHPSTSFYSLPPKEKPIKKKEEDEEEDEEDEIDDDETEFDTDSTSDVGDIEDDDDEVVDVEDEELIDD